MGNRLLVVVSRYSRDIFDPGNFVKELSELISRKGFKVGVLAPHDYNLKFVENINGIKVYRFPYFFPLKCQKVAYGPGILDNLKKSLLAKAQVPLFIISELLYAIKIIKINKIDIIHSHWLIPQGLIGAICSKFYNITHIATVHGSDVNMIKDNRLLKRICSFILNNSNKITINSTFTKKLMLKIDCGENHKKIQIIPMGIDLDRFFSKNGSKLKEKYNAKKLLLFVGRLIDWKGTEYLIKAMKDVVNTFPKIKLLIVGDGPEKPKLEKMIVELKLTDMVYFIGEIKSTEVAKYYSAADIFVIPSIVVDGHTEALGVVTLEAMASGTPVIGSNVGGIPDVIQDGYNGFLVPEKSSDELAKRIIKLLSDKKLTTKFRRNGLKTVREKFSWDVVSEKFIYIFSNI
ncbi:MAG: glycosyltransferase family 4 protein [Bacteroidetes bacterium]|nr:glycosyltransferase family 4 protein [Bacteroidota bacterium]